MLKRLQARLQATSPQKAIVPILGALACVGHASTLSAVSSLFAIISTGLQVCASPFHFHLYIRKVQWHVKPF